LRVAALAACAVLLASGPATAASLRDDYANPAFRAAMGAGLHAFYTRDFSNARTKFEAALGVVPDNTLAISFLNATAAQTPGDLDELVDAEEDRLVRSPSDYVAHVRLGFSYLFSSITGRDRAADAREELDAAVNLDPKAAAAHVGLGIMREDARSANRAKVEFLTALQSDPGDVLAREYLASIYQVDLRDPRRALAYVIDIPNVVPAYADMYYHIASLLDDLGARDAAIKYATRGLEADIGHVGEAGQHGYTLLARIYLGQKKLDDARRVLHAAVAANADAVFAQSLLQKIDAGDYGPTTTK
jgi:tetratricopeptide (TPR) repeat protein